MKVRFLTLAQQELDDAVAWYNEQVAGLEVFRTADRGGLTDSERGRFFRGER
jgi:hypothetical protein